MINYLFTNDDFILVIPIIKIQNNYIILLLMKTKQTRAKYIKFGLRTKI